MENKPRGLCLIINNEHFYDSNGNEILNLRRNGTTMDASRLKNLFEKLHFSVEICVDLDEKSMRSKINSYANQSRINPDAYDALCLIILSHGTDGYLYGVDNDNRINIEKDILNQFDDVMNNKPKLFIFQACRGENLNQKDHSILADTSLKSPFNSSVSSLPNKANNSIYNSIQTTQTLNTTSNQTCSTISSSFNNEIINSNTSDKVRTTNYHRKNINFTDGRPIKTFMPSRSDFFIWYSSVRGFVSMRDPDGSPFIKCLVTVFSRCAYELELVEMVRKVNMLMQQYEMNAYNERNAVAQYFMVPVPEYHLTKHLFFNP